MSKNMLMPSRFVFDVYSLILKLEEYELAESEKTLCRALEAQIKAKIDAMDKRNTFTNYKTALPGSKEREDERKKYLEKSGISSSWISQDEVF